MKILIVHSDLTTRSALFEWVERHTAHVAIAAEPESLAAIIACHEPHLVILNQFSPDQVLFPGIGFCELPEEIENDFGADHPLKGLINYAESIQELNPSAHGYAEDTRCVFQCAKYMAYAGEKRHRAASDQSSEACRQTEEAPFLQQLQTASLEHRHQRAKRYLSTLRRFNRGLQLEMAYRLSHGSYKIAELREQLARWLTVFAHYIDGVEIEHCPMPQNASAHIGYVHYSAPLSHLYAFWNVIQLGVNPAIEAQIMEAMEWKFSGESDSELAAIGCRLMGLGNYLAQAAEAQVRVMEEFLNPNSTFHIAEELPRLTHRRLGIYFEFWGWNDLRESGADLRMLVKRFLKGRLRVTNPLRPPTFREFRDAMKFDGGAEGAQE